MERYKLTDITTYHAGATQAYVNRRLQKVCDGILKPFGVTKMQWLIIGNVLDNGAEGIRISDLADKIGTNAPYLTNAINLLESRGILARVENKADSRSKLVVVTESFATKCPEIETALRNGLRETIYANIDPLEFSIYIKVLEQLAQVDDSFDKKSDKKR